MQMQLNSEKVKRWGDERCWSQEQLAEIASLSLRTVQRVEAGEPASRETVMAIASVFNADASALLLDVDGAAKKAIRKFEAQKIMEFSLSFWIHLVTYVFVAALLIAINLASGREELWSLWPAIGWGIGVAAHGMAVVIVSKTSSAQDQIDALEYE